MVENRRPLIVAGSVNCMQLNVPLIYSKSDKRYLHIPYEYEMGKRTENKVFFFKLENYFDDFFFLNIILKRLNSVDGKTIPFKLITSALTT